MSLSLLGAFFRHPLKFLKMIKIIKSTRIYMNAAVADYFRDILTPLDSPEKAKTYQKIIEEQGYKNVELFKELIALLEKTKYIEIQNSKIHLIKTIPHDILEQTEKKLTREVLEAFKTFIDSTQQAIDDRLFGRLLGEFDSGELRIQWNIALRGDFYRLQRQKAFDFTHLKNWVKRRDPTLTILDYGCGSGDGTRQIYEYINPIGIEFNMEACDIAEGLMEIAEEDETLELPIHYFSLKEQNPPENHYDAIFVSQVFHWVETPTTLVGEMKSWLKPGGIIFGVQSSLSKRLYQVDLFIRLFGAKGFPAVETLKSWFKQNDMTLEYDEVFGSFKAIK